MPTWPTPTPKPPAPTAPGPSQPPLGTYFREREALTEVELANYGYLRQGDCLNEPPDDLKQAPVPTMDCSEPHTNQVMGFVDLSDDEIDITAKIDFEFAVARRCNSLKAILPIPPYFNQGVSATYPDSSEWADGVRVALCWVPVFHTTWVGSAIDGTAAVI